jgi:hypothetical protein
VRVRVCLKAYPDTNQISLQVVGALGDPSPGNVASYVSTVRHSLFKVEALRYPESQFAFCVGLTMATEAGVQR